MKTFEVLLASYRTELFTEEDLRKLNIDPDLVVSCDEDQLIGVCHESTEVLNNSTDSMRLSDMDWQPLQLNICSDDKLEKTINLERFI